MTEWTVQVPQMDKAVEMPYGIWWICGNTSWYCCLCQDEETAIVIARALQAWYDNGREPLGDDYDTHHKNFEIEKIRGANSLL